MPKKLSENIFKKGMLAMLPITVGVIPFGLIMGTVAAEAKLDLLQLIVMNFWVFAGASQLAVVDLMLQSNSAAIIVLTGLIINLRMMLYSASMAPHLKGSGFFQKSLGSYCLTDQSFAVLVSNEGFLKNSRNKIIFYFGSALCMVAAWQSSVLLGYFFGNFAPKSLSLDYAVPLGFISLVIPSLKNKTYILVALFAATLSIFLKNMPYNLGLLTSSLLALVLAALLTRKRVVS